MQHLDQTQAVAYPPTPWNLSGQMWIGMFKSKTPRELPVELKPVLDPHVFMVSVIRYLDGTLRYDELLFGTLAWYGARPGLYVEKMWVDNQLSLWGGRRIWGLPKDMAEFTWEGSTVSVTDSQGLIAKISVDLQPAFLPWMWVSPPEFGRLENNTWLYFAGSIWARWGAAGMKIVEWPERFPALQNDKPMIGFGAKPFRLKMSLPKILKAEKKV